MPSRAIRFTTGIRTIFRNLGYLRLILVEQRLDAWPSRLCIAGVFMSGGSSWRSPSTADQYRHHDYADFAQEFLNRNAGYRQDHADTLARIAQFPRTEITEQEGLSRRWGLSFPLGSTGQSAQKPGALVAGRRARCRDPRSRRYRERNTASAQR